jgi:hypothetical protein
VQRSLQAEFWFVHYQWIDLDGGGPGILTEQAEGWWSSHLPRELSVNRKGIANRTGPESCVVHREVRNEALTGEPAGQPMSRENAPKIRVPTLSLYAEGNTDRRDSASACSTLRGLRPWHVGTLFA